MELVGKKIVLGVTGGIAAYKAAELLRLLMKAGACVQVVMSEAATQFVTPLTFQALSGQAVYTHQWDARIPNNMAHIDLSRRADCVLVAPATADFMAKVAHGLADDLLSTLVLARDCPLLLAPAMNRQMWDKAATQRNVATLISDGITLLGPAHGEQACGENGAGRMLEPEVIVSALIAHFCPPLLVGKKVLLTAGPTFEAIDPVRGITNLSSGKMGFALAAAAQCAGAEVTLVSGPVSLPTPYGVTRIDVVSACDMHAAVMQHIAAQDVFIGVAAVADYRPKSLAAHKLKKAENTLQSIELVQNPDILAAVAARPHPPLCVGFAAETRNLSEYARRKRREKNIPLIVGNLIDEGFGGENNHITLFAEDQEIPLPAAKKSVLAQTVIAHIAAYLRPQS